MDVNVRKTQAGADSFGNTWPEDGAVVRVPYDQAVILLAIPDGGFSVVDTPAEAAPAEDPQAVPEPSSEPEPDGDEAAELSELDPDAPEGEPVTEPEPEAKPAAKKTAARKTTASRKTVEE
ncbi:hypothetical protein ACH40F_07720 [Streptomyces sp. NPDC020794]|uniref:hypothetical protein n=1 Tax=unclassified Streptomyces TaxID=2593676 RepID=UPI0036EBCBA0